jgi:predicted DNA-binding transcriptional regulator AlpA
VDITDLISRRDIAKLAGKSEQWIAQLMCKDTAPKPVSRAAHYGGGSCPMMYDRITVEDWIHARVTKPKPKTEAVNFTAMTKQLFKLRK